MIRAVTLFIILFLGTLSAQEVGFVHPLDFKDSETERQKVIKYIEANVYETYSKINMDNPATLRMMEKEELNAFKQLTKMKDRTLLNKVIKTYCDIGMCNYTTILMMYNEEIKASQESLTW